MLYLYFNLYDYKADMLMIIYFRATEKVIEIFT